MWFCFNYLLHHIIGAHMLDLYQNAYLSFTKVPFSTLYHINWFANWCFLISLSFHLNCQVIWLLNRSVFWGFDAKKHAKNDLKLQYPLYRQQHEQQHQQRCYIMNAKNVHAPPQSNAWWVVGNCISMKWKKHVTLFAT